MGTERTWWATSGPPARAIATKDPQISTGRGRWPSALRWPGTLRAVLPFAVFTIAGASALLAAMLPRVLHGRAFSLPLAFLLLGVALGSVPGLPALDPMEHGVVVEHLTEVVVIIALMGAGLAIDRPLGWRRWASAWRLIVVAMPLTIIAVAVSGSVLAGLPLAAAVLLGAVMAPTDPVLAGDVQVGEPSESTSEDEVRFAVTAEAGLNDGAAFPVVYLPSPWPAPAGGAGCWPGECWSTWWCAWPSGSPSAWPSAGGWGCRVPAGVSRVLRRWIAGAGGLAC